jgi:hypothetical protein
MKLKLSKSTIKILFKYTLCFIAFICFIYGLFGFLGLKKETISIPIYVTGNINRQFITDTDYLVDLNYSAKDAFIAGEPIHIKALLVIKNKTITNRNFLIVFNDASEYPKNISRQFSPSIKFDINKNQEQYEAEKDIVYYQPGDYFFDVYVDDTNQQIRGSAFFYNEDGIIQMGVYLDKNFNYVISPSKGLHVAPLDERYQIRTNESVLNLTYFIIALTLLQIFIEINSNDKQ